MRDSGNILFCGVGGQGILLASEITAHTLLAAGMDVKKSEVHGMAQRGGSVIANLRYGPKVYSPLIDPGRADICLAFEKMEAARYLPFLHGDSVVVVNTHAIPPPSVATGKAAYPAGVLDVLAAKVRVIPVDAFAIAESVGEIRAANVALVGAMSTLLPFDGDLFIEVMKKRLPAKILDVNLAAFAQGREAVAGT